MPGQAAVFVDRYEISISGFEYSGNFWATFNQEATTGGPSPVDVLTIAMTVAHRGPDDRAGAYHAGALSVRDFTAAVTLNDLPGFAPANLPFSRIVAPMFDPASGGGAAGLATRPGSSGKLAFMYIEPSRGVERTYFEASFDLNGLLNDPARLHGARAEVSFEGSPIPFDTPRYASVFSPQAWTVERTPISVTLGAVPAPAGIWLGLSGLLAFGLVRGRPRV